MPNWVTTRISASKNVIESMINEEGRIDFMKVLPINLPHSDWSAICCAAETAAKKAINAEINSHPLIGAIEQHNREESDIKKLDEKSFSQFIGMLENYRATGYLHEMDFARKEWGTKWNACEPTASPEEGKASFDTAWSCPVPVLVSLSKKHPDDLISVIYADEALGCNCGKFTLMNGEIVEEDIAPPWKEMTKEQRTAWEDFALSVKGW